MLYNEIHNLLISNTYILYNYEKNISVGMLSPYWLFCCVQLNIDIYEKKKLNASFEFVLINQICNKK